MARLRVEGGELVLGLSRLEKVEGWHGEIRVPVSAVRGVWFTADPWSVLRGFRFPGTGGLGSIAVGTWRGSGVKDFVVLHGRGPAVVVELEGAEFARLLVSEDDAEAHAAWLRRAAGLA